MSKPIKKQIDLQHNDTVFKQNFNSDKIILFYDYFCFFKNEI
jgi:hypothetical protein